MLAGISDSQAYRSVSAARSVSLCSRGGFSSLAAGTFLNIADAAPYATAADQGYGRGGTPIFTDLFEPLARVALYPTDEDGLGTCFGAA